MSQHLKKILDDSAAWLNSIDEPINDDIPESVVTAMTTVRDSGQSLFERQTVISQINGFNPDAGRWISDHPRAYNRILRKLIGKG